MPAGHQPRCHAQRVVAASCRTSEPPGRWAKHTGGISRGAAATTEKERQRNQEQGWEVREARGAEIDIKHLSGK